MTERKRGITARAKTLERWVGTGSRARVEGPASGRLRGYRFRCQGIGKCDGEEWENCLLIASIFSAN